MLCIVYVIDSESSYIFFSFLFFLQVSLLTTLRSLKHRLAAGEYKSF